MRFRKKPVEVEARCFRASDPVPVIHSLALWCGGTVDWDRDGRPTIEIATLEGIMIARDGDWIIQGVKGEFYPCKPDIMAATYEPEPEGA